MDYIELEYELSPYAPWAEILISQLAEVGFESFTENHGRVQAYIQKDDYDEEMLLGLHDTFRQQLSVFQYEKKLIPHENWNATWEEGFSPVTVGNELIIHAPFHTIDEAYRFKVVIQPQMSFGTGHHQTTYLLSKRMLSLDLKHKSVLDVGTGTGILAILAKLLGAKSCVTTEIDPGSCENAIENFERNNCKEIVLIQGDIHLVEEHDFDVVLANINKNVLQQHLPHYAKLIAVGGTLLLSGFFETDTEELILSAKNCNFTYVNTYVQETWAVLEFTKHA